MTEKSRAERRVVVVFIVFLCLAVISSLGFVVNKARTDFSLDLTLEKKLPEYSVLVDVRQGYSVKTSTVGDSIVIEGYERNSKAFEVILIPMDFETGAEEGEEESDA